MYLCLYIFLLFVATPSILRRKHFEFQYIHYTFYLQMPLRKASVTVSDSCRVVYQFFSSLRWCGRDRRLGRGLGRGLGCEGCMDRADGHSCPPHPGPPCGPHPDALHTLHSLLPLPPIVRRGTVAATIELRFSELCSISLHLLRKRHVVTRYFQLSACPTPTRPSIHCCQCPCSPTHTIAKSHNSQRP